MRAFVEVDPHEVGQQIHGVPVLEPGRDLAIRSVWHLAAVGRPAARDRVRALFSGAGFEELRDFAAIA